LRLAEFYLKGLAVEQDEERALELMRRAADQDYAPAMRELALLYARGIGEPRNRDEQPLQLLKRVTQLQEINERSVSEWAYQDIVRNYQYGIGTQKDLVAAAQWYCRGALAGVWFFSPEKIMENRPSSAQGITSTSTPDLRFLISLILPEQEGEEFRPVLRSYLRAASAKGGAVALQFGEHYFSGRDAPADLVKAWCWFKVAAARNAPGADARISAAEADLSDEQKIQAQSVLADLTKDLQNLLSSGLPRSGSAEQP
jgi:TPR repeat protein